MNMTLDMIRSVSACSTEELVLNNFEGYDVPGNRMLVMTHCNVCSEFARTIQEHTSSMIVPPKPLGFSLGSDHILPILSTEPENRTHLINTVYLVLQ